IKRPSGDNDGSNSGQGDRVRRLRPVPSALMDQTSWKSSKTIRPESEVISIAKSTLASIPGETTSGEPVGPPSADPEQPASTTTVRTTVAVRIPLLRRAWPGGSVRCGLSGSLVPGRAPSGRPPLRWWVTGQHGTITGRTAPDPPVPLSDATSPVTDPVSNVLPSPTPSISEATAPISDAIGDATDAVSSATSSAAGTAAGATGDATARGAGPAAPAGAQTSDRGGQDASGCAPGACGRPDSDSSLGRAVERVLGFLAETGSTLLPWIALAGGLGVLGVVLLRASRRRRASRA